MMQNPMLLLAFHRIPHSPPKPTLEKVHNIKATDILLAFAKGDPLIHDNFNNLYRYQQEKKNTVNLFTSRSTHSND